MTKKVLNASVDTIVYIGLHVCEDEVLHVQSLDEGRYRDGTQGGDTSIRCQNLLLPHLWWQLENCSYIVKR